MKKSGYRCLPYFDLLRRRFEGNGLPLAGLKRGDDEHPSGRFRRNAIDTIPVVVLARVRGEQSLHSLGIGPTLVGNAGLQVIHVEETIRICGVQVYDVY